MTSRELVYETLEFRNTAHRAPRYMWSVPWSRDRYPEAYRLKDELFPDDIINAPNVLKVPPRQIGDPYAVGSYTDPFGSVFENVQPGVLGEMKSPQILDDEWEDADKIRIPEEYLTLDIDAVNRFCDGTDKFVTSGVWPRPFERLQFLRGSENLYMDLADPPDGFFRFLKKLHDFNCRLLELWAKTRVDTLKFMDDWGAQKSLLIRPQLWAEIFKPLYRDYIDIAHSSGKKIFMHSDGNTFDIYPHLIELGLDALHSQIFCIGVDKLEQFAGKITFWGELDRQWILPYGTTQDVREGAEKMYKTLWRNGGCIAACDFGPGAKPENVLEFYKTWDEMLPG